jgi:hypothetical protein
MKIIAFISTFSILNTLPCERLQFFLVEDVHIVAVQNVLLVPTASFSELFSFRCVEHKHKVQPTFSHSNFPSQFLVSAFI